jgi:hypothetical protein
LVRGNLHRPAAKGKRISRATRNTLALLRNAALAAAGRSLAR